MSAPYIPQIALYRQWLKDTRGLSFGSYDEMWRWSVTDLDAYWQSIWDYFSIQSPTPHSAVLGRRDMPNAVWFPGAQVNYAQADFPACGGCAARRACRRWSAATRRAFIASCPGRS